MLSILIFMHLLTFNAIFIIYRNAVAWLELFMLLILELPGRMCMI
jgi:hypothetical protein